MNSSKTLFHINSDKPVTGEETLLLQIGKDHAAYGVFNKAEAAITEIKYLTYNSLDIEASLEQMIDDINNDKFNKIVVSSSFPEALVIPNKFNKSDSKLLAAIYEVDAAPLSDELPEWQLATLYAIPVAVRELLNRKFNNIQYLHSYTSAIKVYNGSFSNMQFNLDFTPSEFSVVVKNGQQLQLVQTYNYNSALDVVYYLLKICYDLGIAQTDVHLVLSGLIDKDSGLYTELKNYFAFLHFPQATTYKIPESEHPQYFFNSIYNLAACA